jgi:uncharacterized membrane protein YfcA
VLVLVELTWDAWLIIALALAAGGLTKGITGLGLPAVAVPIMASFLGVKDAVMIMLFPTLVTNAWLAWKERDTHVEVPELSLLLLAGIPGVGLGAVVLSVSSGRFLETVLSVWILVYLVLRFLRPELRLSKKSRRQLAPPVGFACGALQGATGICAPVLVPYVDALGVGARTYVFAFSAVFMFLGFGHITMLAIFGAFPHEQLIQSLIAVIPAMIFVPIGRGLRHYIHPDNFGLLIRAVLFVTAVRLFYGAWLS